MRIRLLALLFLLPVMTIPLFASGAQHALPVAVSENASKVLRVEDGELAGMAAPLYQCVFDRTGLTFSFTQMPLARALFNYEHGEVAAVVPLARSPERDEHGEFAGPLLEVQYVLLSPQELSSLESIKNKFYVIPRGHLGKQFVAEHVPGGFEVNSWEQVFSMLSLGRADFTVVPELILEDIVSATQTTFYTLPVGFAPSSVYVSDDYLASELDERLKESVAACRQIFADDIRQKQGGGRTAGKPGNDR